MTIQSSGTLRLLDRFAEHGFTYVHLMNQNSLSIPPIRHAQSLKVEYQRYSACLARFFGIQPMPGETIATDGKVLRGSYEAISDDPSVESHPAIMLVSAYIVERGLILEPYEVDSKTNEITALPAFIEQMALKGVVFAFDAYALGGAKLYSTQKNSSDDH